MTNPRIQESFHPFDFLPDGSVNLHRHSSPTDTLAVFVHGLMGEGYGTWGDFPFYVFSQQMDVAIFEYPTGLRRSKRAKNPSPEASARLLSQELTSLGSEYRHIFLLGHSMGGLVAALAAHNYFSQLPPIGQGSSITPLAGLLTFATPLGGSLRVTVPMPSDFRFLAIRNRAMKKFRQYRSQNIDYEISRAPNSNRFSFTMSSLSATNDIWVRRTNSALGIPPRQSEDCGGSHTELVKPPTADHRSVQWTLRTISQVRFMRSRVERVSADPLAADTTIAPDFIPGLLVAKMWNTSDAGWVKVFNDALAITAERFSLSVLDSRSVAKSLRPNLVVHAMQSATVIEDPHVCRSTVLQQLSVSLATSYSQVALGPVGSKHPEAADIIRQWLVETGYHEQPWVEGVPTTEALGVTIAGWLAIVARAHLHTASSLPNRRRSDALHDALAPTSDTVQLLEPFGGDA